MSKQKECHPDNKYRCQSSGSGGEGQCRYYSIMGLVLECDSPDYDDHRNVDLCPKHGHQKWISAGKRALHDYRLGIWQRRAEEFIESTEVKNLRGEIGVLRLLLENIVNRCKDEDQLEMYSPKIADLAVKLSSLVTQCDRLEDKQGASLDRQKAIRFADKLALLVSKYIPDGDVRERATEDVHQLMQDLLS